MNTSRKISLLGIITLLLVTTFSFAQDPKSLYDQGIDKLKRLKRVEAKNIFTEIINLDNKYAPAYYQRGLIFKHFNDTDKALEDFKQVTFLEGDFKTEAHFEIGLIKVDQKDYKGSVIDFSHVLNEDSTNSRAYYLRGVSNKLSKQHEVALIDFKSAIKFDSNNVDAYFQKGETEIDTEEFDEAIKTLTTLLAKSPEHSMGYFFRGIAYFEEATRNEYHHHHKHYQEALADFDKCLDLDESLEAAYFDRGEVKMALKDYIGAISDFKRAIERDSKDLEAHYLKAMCNFHYGYEETAHKEMQDILKMDSTYANAQYQVAFYLHETQEYKLALEAFNKLFQLEEPHSDAYIYRGWTRFELGDKEGACDDWAKGVELGDKEAEHDIKKYCHKK